MKCLDLLVNIDKYNRYDAIIHMSDPISGQATSPFHIRAFRSLWLGNLVSNMGGLMQSAATAWLMASFTQSARMVALVQVAATLPVMLLSPWAGAIADGFDRRRIMIATQSALAVVSTCLALFALAGYLTPWLLLAFTFLVASGAAINSTAWQASVGDVVSRPLLPAAIAYNSMGFNLARCFGPALGGALLAAVGAAGAFAFNAASYFAPIVALFKWKPTPSAPTRSREPVAAAIATGVRYLGATRPIRRLIARAFLFGTSAAAVPALLPLVVQERFAGGGITYGILLGCFGFGAIAGASLLMVMRRRWHADAVLAIAAVQASAGAIIVGLSHSLPLTGIALLVAGCGWLQSLSTLNALVQLGSASWVTGRVVSLYRVAAFAGITSGSWLAGELAHAKGLSIALSVAGTAQLLVLVVGLLKPVRVAGESQNDPLDQWRVPETALDVEARSGPVYVSVEYEIADENVQIFLEAMQERRRIRVRDGARRWTLVRDIGCSCIWRERYEVYDWSEYLRHNSRRTLADKENTELVHRLHQGTHPLMVRRELFIFGGSGYRIDALFQHDTA